MSKDADPKTKESQKTQMELEKDKSVPVPRTLLTG